MQRLWCVLFSLVIAGFAAVAEAVVTITVTTTADSGAGSLRQALTDANLSLDSDPVQIHFAIGTGAQSIAPVTALPNITRRVSIDATTQPGFAGSPLIELRGDMAPLGTSGLTLAGHSGSTIRGLVINRFQPTAGGVGGHGIVVAASSNDHVIVGNWLGTNAAGTAAAANGRSGIFPSGNNIRIGGTTPADRNVISGNVLYGVLMNAGTGTIIIGNYIGLNAAGTARVPNNDGFFILDNAKNATIGGDLPGEANVITGNANADVAIGNPSASGHVIRGNLIGTNPAGTGSLASTSHGVALNTATQITIERNVIGGHSTTGVRVLNPSSAIVVRGNTIGTNANGTIALPISGRGIDVSFAASGAPSNVTIGGTAAGEANVIRNCTLDGVALRSGVAPNIAMFTAPVGVRIRGNAIGSNGGLGIDLDDDGITVNDPLDADDDSDGSNLRQNFPVITSATLKGSGVVVAGTLDSLPSTMFAVDVFGVTTADPSGNGEGETYVGTLSVMTDGTGQGTLSGTLSVVLAAGSRVTATATDPAGNTSEFSAAVLGTNDGMDPPPAPTTTTTSTSSTSTSTSTTSTSTTSTSSTSTTSTSSSTTSTSSSSVTSSTAATTTTTSMTFTTTSTSSTSTSVAVSTTTTSSLVSTSTTPVPTTTTTTTSTLPCQLTAIPQVLCVLDALPPDVCDGQTPPKGVARGLSASRKMLDRAGSASGPPAQRLLRRAAARLKKTRGAIDRAGKRGKLSLECASAFANEVAFARDLTLALVVP